MSDGVLEARDRLDVVPPTFGGTLRRIRDDRGVSREKLAFAAGVSASYIAHLESGEREHPTRSVVDALLRYLDRVVRLPADDRRHLFELAGLAVTEVPTVDELRAGIGPAMRRGLSLHEPNPAGFFDARWNLLAVNRVAAAMFPGLAEGGNMLHWMFGDPGARRALPDWDQVTALSVANLRGRIGRPGEAGWAGALLAELSRYPEFRRLWSTGAISYGGDLPALRFHDAAAGAPCLLEFQVYEVDSGVHPGWIRFFLGFRSS
ncbi:helix-turn-helix transcriptional regulator [Nocardia sp. NPDC050697]|uniref:helix-turn-helix domain-containing protein n=1 Tax=Nocardia sp. NPDC050697 TaxID=3155158 RepID=UPI0033CBAA6C